MNIYEKDYRYLLVNLIPQHRLSPGIRREIERVLSSGSARDLRRQSIRALEELCDTDYFERAGIRTENGSVVLDYKRRGGRYVLSLALPREEWDHVPVDSTQQPASPDQRRG